MQSDLWVREADITVCHWCSSEKGHYGWSGFVPRVAYRVERGWGPVWNLKEPAGEGGSARGEIHSCQEVLYFVVC